MVSATSLKTALPPDWTRALDQVEEALASAVTLAGLRVQEMSTWGADGSDCQVDDMGTWEARLGNRLEQLAERLRLLQDCVKRAEETAADTDTILRAGEEAIHHWLAAARSVPRQPVRARIT